MISLYLSVCLVTKCCFIHYFLSHLLSLPPSLSPPSLSLPPFLPLPPSLSLSLSLPPSLSLSANPSVISGIKLVTALDNTYPPPNERSFGMLISGNPHPNFTWTHNGDVIHDSDDDKILIIQNGPHISILNLIPPFLFKHAGTYRVNATNEHRSTSDFFEIAIQGKGERGRGRDRERGERERETERER